MILLTEKEWLELKAARDELADLKEMLDVDRLEKDQEDDDWLVGTCNPNAPEECESCQ